ncbi:protein dachsous-like [Haliotis rufescens]|uniref:protein dachsous-like n=1 Tax=Haliotis rufescens TaxID=6454 RepID=UPI00201EA5FF|nr:protein dachsous-like [Haliotis rufescens]
MSAYTPAMRVGKGERKWGTRLLVLFLLALSPSKSKQQQIKETFEVMEEEPPGTRIGRIGASNSNIVPPIEFVIPENNFRLDQQTGTLFTKLRLDRESKDLYSFYVQDSNSEFIDVQVRLVDINDNSPSFPNKTQTLRISEGAPKEAKYPLGTATDRDSLFGIQDCRIVSGNDEQHFRLETRTSGSFDWLLDLLINKELDYETQSRYDLVIRASDGGNPPKTAELNLEILLIDQNDNQPRFTLSRYHALIPENTTIGTSVLQVSATDDDAGENGIVTYQLDPQSERAKYFRVDPVTGVVRVNKPLDYETIPNFRVAIFAKDNGSSPQRASAALEIDLKNINELPANISLTFLQSDGNKTGKISENVREGTLVARISITDPDSPKEYFDANITLLGGDGVFDLHESSGVVYLIVVSKPPDREVKPFYNLTVIATDAGEPPLHASYSFTIWIEDINDNDPVFTQQIYTAEIHEVAEPGTYVVKVSATDPDDGNNARILYSISDRTPTSWFQIDSNTGLITTKSAIDCEIEAQPRLTVIASDGGETPRISSATVIITVRDVNDKQPEFDQSFYSASVPEDKAVGQCILQVSAIDPECGQNSPVTYDMEGVGRPQEFSINSDSGKLCIASPLDYEQNPTYNFMVKASDREGLSTNTLVRITVEDVNDNRPVFDPATYNTNIKEGLSLQPLLTVHAQDSDDGVFGTVRYSIQKGNNQGLFAINPSNGVISLAKMLPNGERIYDLEVQATDGGGLQASQPARVKVSITGASAFPPTFNHLLYNFSISEGAGANRVIGSISATSEDPHSPRVKYRILSGGNNWFAISASTGSITAVGDLDRETRTSVLLSVEAEAGNPPNFSTAQVNITILDINDNSPGFAVSNNYLEINEREDRDMTSNIYVVQATDGDNERNGTIQYSLLNNPGNLFRIDPMSGEIRLQGKLDYEHQQRYEMQIVAADQGVPTPRSSTMTLVINVKDVNDNPPTFARSVYNFSVRENIQLTASFAQINATDRDSNENGRVFYIFEDSMYSSVFGINPPNGNLYVKEPLDREEIDLYVLTVIASDHGKPSRLTSTAQVRIHVTDENDNNPVFSSGFYHFTIQENLPIASTVGRVMALDSDINQNAELQFRFLNTPPKFVINPHNGEITTMERLDRELESDEVLTVIVSDMGTPPRSASATVKIDVLDINDNPPEFDRREPKEATVDENRPKGTKVMQVIATDQDAGENGTVAYSLANAPGENAGTNNFAIHASSGWITTKEVLDFETRQQYKLEVIARDNGVRSQQSRQTIVVSVGDVNDQAPLFHAKNVTFDVVENTDIGTVVGVVTAHDRDSGENGRVSYYIISGNVFSLFTVDRITGEITSIREIDYEESSSHILGIRAIDNNALYPKSSNISVTIRVVDINDNAPVFEQDPVLLRTVKENTPTGHAVYTFTATDKDSGQNGTVQYRITSESYSGPNPDAGSYFMIDASSGQLKIKKNIDYEKVHQISLIVEALDKCPTQDCMLNASVTTIVYVIDVNDNNPIFESPAQVEIFEDENVDYPVLYLLATDKDANENNSGNNLVTYKILSGNNADKFDLESTTGLLTIANSLNREEKSSYALNISAEDHGSPKRISHKVLNIIIKDVNDNAPHFTNSTYHASIPEHASSDSVVVTVHATDADVGSNARLTYMIPSGIADNKFTIDSTTGVVKATMSLDREEKDTYIVSVYVRDGGYPTNYDQATIIISILDINDNTPVFKSKTYKLNIPENSEQTSIFAFTAYDADSGQNADILYSITDGNEEGKFSVDPITGDLSCKTLDRESTEEYNLTIAATDRGSVPRSGESLAFITVLDENDNDPHFSQPMYSSPIPEDIQRGHTVLQVMATDADKGHNGDLTYSLGNDTEGLFSVNASSGEITTTGLFDREKKSSYSFDIVAMDGGISGPRNSTARVDIIISDINDNAPVFAEVPYRRSVGPSTGRGVEILTVSATDPDEGDNGDVEYRMDLASGSEQYFEMNGAAIITKRDLGGAVGYHNIQIVVMDKGNPVLSSTGVVEITVGSPSSPSLSFTQEVYHQTIREDRPNGTGVIQVGAMYDSHIVTYRFAGGNNGNPFSINTNNGMISVHNTDLIDYEMSPRVRLIVQAAAGGVVAYATVWVNLTDVNDNVPKFTQNKYITSVWENNAPETFVTMVQANDEDTGRNGQVLYSIINGNKDDAFVIQPPYTGIIITSKDSSSLDREIQDTYQLTIEAVDQGNPSLSSTCILSINVNDENDNAPFFRTFQSVHISEIRKVGSQVTTVTATDVDFQPKLVYSFQPNSNGDGSFSIDRFSGSISLAKAVDHEVRNHYVLGIMVSDGKHNAFTQIDIYIDDENDNAPEFSQQNYQVALEEATPPGRSVITVNATDADSGINKVINYSLRSNFNNSFYINSNTGTIYTNKSLTYEAFSSIIELVVIAQDGGSPTLSDMVAVHIQITDINKYSPQFEQTSYEVNISEFSVRGESILYVSAIDRDITHIHRDDNVNYKLIGEGANTFQIRRKTGQIFLMSQANRENVSQYNLTAVATDRGHPPKSSSVPVKIIVEDENDNPPRFHEPDNIYHVLLPENTPPEKVFEHVVADDADEGLHAEIQYTITSGNNEGIFHIHGTNGSLFIMPGAHLDYESHKSHRLIVRAVDCTRCLPDQPRLSAFVTIQINVSDVNEFQPEFPISPYNECVKENQPPNTTVFQAQANDGDGGMYGILTYSILQNSSDAGHFSINSKTGHILTRSEFNYEARNSYSFHIKVQDPQYTSVVDVTVKVLDVDEYVPKFFKERYNFNVSGSARRGDYVGQVSATDQDGGNAGKVVYMIEYSDDYFEINPTTGNITVKRSFHEDAPSQRRKRALTGDSTPLIIRAWSGREDSLESTSRVEVAIDRDCEGCVYVPQPLVDGMSKVAIAMIIVVSVLVLLATIIVIICLVSSRRRRNKRPPHDPNENVDSAAFSFTPPPAMRPHINGGPPPYKEHLHFGPDASNVTSSDISDQSHSASSGRGSAEEEEDEEIRMINSNTQLQSSQTFMRRKQMPDSGIQQDEDTLSEPSVQNHQEYLAKLGIDSTKIGKPKPKAHQIAHSVESMHQFSDEGGGEGNVDMGHSDYDKMTDMETDEEVAMIDRNKDLGFHEPETQHAGSLSSVINSEEEYSGSYNWDYLLNWGPQYQPLAHVFAEIAKLKDDNVQPRKPPVRTVPQRHLNTQLTPKVKMVPPPMITNAPPKAFAPRPSHTSSGSSSRGIPSARASTMNTSMPSLPRSPISYDSSVTSPALTPSFTPSLSPLATGSPSPVVSAHGSAHSSGHNTPGKGVSKQNIRLAMSASSESEQEFRI